MDVESVNVSILNLEIEIYIQAFLFQFKYLLKNMRRKLRTSTTEYFNDFNQSQNSYKISAGHELVEIIYALFVTSKIEFSKPPILESKRLQKGFKIKNQGLKHFLK